MIKKELSGEDISMQELREQFGVKGLGEQTEAIKDANRALKAAKGKNFEPIKTLLAQERKTIGEQREKLGHVYKLLTGEDYREDNTDTREEKHSPEPKKSEDDKVRVLRARMKTLKRRSSKIDSLLGPQEEISLKKDDNAIDAPPETS